MSSIQQEAQDLRIKLVGLVQNLNATYHPTKDEDMASYTEVITSAALYEAFLNKVIKDQVQSRYQTEFTDYKLKEVFEPIQEFCVDVEKFLSQERLKSA